MSAVPKSVASFVRRKLKLRGKTIHFGRGFTIMEHSATTSEVYNGLMEIVKKNSHLIANVREDNFTLRIVFVDAKDQQDYRMIVFCKNLGYLYNVM